MPELFISHSAIDKIIVKDLAQRLRQRKISSFFLSFDPETGIPPGRSWEKELYRNLLNCSAVLFMASPHSLNSKWCFAEISQARALGRRIIPIKIAECDLENQLREIQCADLTTGEASAYKQLWNELDRIGLSDRARFRWDGQRPLYPGISHFDMIDAATFFGRTKEIQELASLLERLRLADQGLLQVVGASGTGKSSLVRAGLLARLSHEQDKWLVLPPDISGPAVLENLAEQLAGIMPDAANNPGTAKIYEMLTMGSNAGENYVGSDFSFFLRDLRRAGGQHHARILWSVDQAERLLIDGRNQNLALAFIRRSASTPGLPFHTCLAVRSDHFDALQQKLESDDTHSETFWVRPLSASHFAEVIEAPARLAGLTLAPGLVTALVQDAQRRDGLPLLAFALRELWDRFGKSTLNLSLDDYTEKLGGLQGCVSRKVESIMESLQLTGEEKNLLFRTLSRMTRISEADSFIAEPLDWASVPEQIHPVFMRFIDEHLLVSGRGGQVEIAHEILFQAWEGLRRYLLGLKEFLSWKRQFTVLIENWIRHDRQIDQIHLSGAALGEAQTWLKKNADNLNADEVRFIRDSLNRARREEKRWRQSYLTSLRQLAAQAQNIIRQDTADLSERGLLLAVEAMHRLKQLGVRSIEADQAVRQGLSIMARKVARPLIEHPVDRNAIDLHPTEFSVAVGQHNGQILIANLSQGELEPPIALNGKINCVVFSPDGKWLAAGDSQGSLVLMSHADQAEKKLPAPEGSKPVHAICFSRDSNCLAVAFSKDVCVWDLLSDEAPIVLKHESNTNPIVSMTFNAAGDVLVTQAVTCDALCWKWRDQKLVGRIGNMGNYVTHSADGRFLGISSAFSFEAWLWDIYRQERHVIATNSAKLVFSNDGRYAAIASPEHFARIWQLPQLNPVHNLKHNAEVWDLEFSPDGNYLVTKAKDNIAYVWNMTTGEQTAWLLHDENLNAVRFFGDSRHVLTHSGDSICMVWDTQDLREKRLLRHQVAVLGVAFSPENSNLLATQARASQFDRSYALIDWPTQQLVRSYAASDKEIDGTAYAEHLIKNHGEKMRNEVESPNHQFVAVSKDEAVRVFDRNRSEESDPVCVMNHDRKVRHVLFSPDSAYLLTISDHGPTRIWEISTGLEVARLTHDNPAIVDADFSPDGKYIATASFDHTARIWLWHPQDLIQEAITRISRQLTPEEWAQYLPGESYQPAVQLKTDTHRR